MTTINKLSIRGIRSFGIDKDDEQVIIRRMKLKLTDLTIFRNSQKIEFSSPLTLIVGQNGCGKTTVIECLKYALTGDTPFGNFVRDPKISKVAAVMAQVKLTVNF